tara:strand:+ start:4198 stop:5379 length:1182 start_codon:yes stop_codon:yes gene_type:complete
MIPSLPYEYPLLPANASENGRTGAWTAVDANQSLGYYLMGTGARWRFTTSARRMQVRCYGTGGDRQIGIRVADGSTVREYWFGAPQSGVFTTNQIWLPPGVNKTVELLVPGQHAQSQALSFAGTPIGAFPVAVSFDMVATTIAPTTPTNRLMILGDSISVGGNAASEALLGYAGLMKRGLTCQLGTSPWRGAWAGGTAYSIGDLVSSGKLIWRALTANTGVTPVSGTDWAYYGYNGTVTLWRTWGFKRIADDWSSSGDRTANAALIQTANPTQIVVLLGSNDYATVPNTTLANFQTYYEGMLDAIHAVLPSLKITCVSQILRGTDGANSIGVTAAQYRTVISDAVTARSGWTVPPVYVDGQPICVSGDLADGVHPTTAGHATKMFPAIMAAVA